MKINIIHVSIICIGMAAILLSILHYSSVVSKEKVKTSIPITVDSAGNEIEIVRIDGCEYIRAKLSSMCMIYAHKGDCDNPIHMYNK